MRSKISSALADLNRLSETYDWIPNEHTIRPSDYDLAIKRQKMAEIEATWPSVREFIKHSIFKNILEPPNWIFEPSIFRYNLPNHSNHYILWFSNENYFYEFPEEIINNHLNTMLKNLLGHENFMFAWYKNPKPTVVEFWHVQVFWCSTC